MMWARALGGTTLAALLVTMRRAALVPVVLLNAVATMGCAAWEVKRRFVIDGVCPSDRVTVTQAGVVTAGPPPPAPPEIAADPERLAIYYEKTRNPDEGDRIFIAEGCGERRWYTCDYPGAGPRRAGCLPR